MRKSKTHFEQIPLEVAKRAASQEGFKGTKAGGGTLILEPASKKNGPHALKPGSLRKDGN